MNVKNENYTHGNPYAAQRQICPENNDGTVKRNKYAGLFYYIDDIILIHCCALDKAEDSGEFLNLPKSHYEIWEKYYAAEYHVDFDYYPRGRVVYRKADQAFLIYYDRCLKNIIQRLAYQFEGQKAEYHLDEHYQCHMCNRNYVS